MSLLTADDLATYLGMSAETVRDWHRKGKIKSELKIGRSPRFDLGNVRKQLVKQSNSDGAVPTI